MYGRRGGVGPAKQGKILLNLALCPANLYLEVGKYAVAYRFNVPKEYFKSQYFEVLDLLMNELKR